MTNENNEKDAVQTLWQRIEGWLSQHAPHAWQMLRLGARDQEIQQAEVAMDMTLPEDFQASCRIHDGGYVLDLVTDMMMFSLKEMVAEWQMFQELEEVGTWSDANPPYYFTERIIRTGWQTGPIQPT
jgi:cell wall assembly regulator SMI1